MTLSPILGGEFVPVSLEAAGGLETEKAYGALALRLVLIGRLKYKMGPFYSAWVEMLAQCDLLASLKSSEYGQVPILDVDGCSVSS